MSSEVSGVGETGKKAGDLVNFLRGQEVSVVDGRGYEGWLYDIDEHLENYTLLDVESDTGDFYSSKGFERPELVSPEDYSFRLAHLDMDDLSDSPYAIRSHSADDLSGYISKVEDRGSLIAVPVVREVDDEFEIVDGHKGRFIADQAGLESQTCIVEDFSDSEAAAYFVQDHIPPENPEFPEDDGWYRDDEIREALERLERDFGDEIYQIDRLKNYRERFSEEASGRDIDHLLELEPEEFAREKIDKI